MSAMSDRDAFAVLNLLILNYSQLELKIGAAELALQNHPDLAAEYHSKLQLSRDRPAEPALSQALAALRQKLFPRPN